MVNQERCDELREALGAAMAQMTLPMRDRVDRGPGGLAAANTPSTEPQGSPELEEEIRRLEQALRDEGCEAE